MRCAASHCIVLTLLLQVEMINIMIKNIQKDQNICHFSKMLDSPRSPNLVTLSFDTSTTPEHSQIHLRYQNQVSKSIGDMCEWPRTVGDCASKVQFWQIIRRLFLSSIKCVGNTSLHK